MSKKINARDAARTEAKTHLLSREGYGLKPGDTIYTIVTRVSRDGMGRDIRCFVVQKGRVLDISRWVAQAIGSRFINKDSRYGVVVAGCGMDMGFHVVNSLSYALHGYGETPKNRDKTPSRAGYTFRHEWL